MKRQACLNELAAVIANLKLSHPARVAIDGVDGVGKTTLADELAETLRKSGREIIRASIDGFHNPRATRYARGADSAEGYFLDSFNYEALRSALLEPLGPGGHRRYRKAVFDYRIDSLVESSNREAALDAVLLFDGVFLLRPGLLAHWDLRIWMDAPFEITVERAIRRDSVGHGAPEALKAMYARRYVPGQQIYLERCQPRRLADIVVNNAELSSPELEFVDTEQSSRVEHELE